MGSCLSWFSNKKRDSSHRRPIITQHVETRGLERASQLVGRGIAATQFIDTGYNGSGGIRGEISNNDVQLLVPDSRRRLVNQGPAGRGNQSPGINPHRRGQAETRDVITQSIDVAVFTAGNLELIDPNDPLYIEIQELKKFEPIKAAPITSKSTREFEPIAMLA